jgi:hypothetical protein
METKHFRTAASPSELMHLSFITRGPTSPDERTAKSCMTLFKHSIFSTALLFTVRRGMADTTP